eukprot:UN32259
MGVLLGQFPKFISLFALTPDVFMNKFKVYTLLTTTFVEVNLLIGLTHIIVCMFAGAFLEKRWGTRRFLKFICIVGLGSEICVLFTMTFLYYLTFEDSYLFDPLCGFSCVAGGFTVAMGQLLHDQIISQLPMFNFQYFPMLSFLFTICAWFFGAPLKELWLVAYGIYFGWFYLRFFDLHPLTNEPGGDDREEFELAQLFPPVIKIPVKIVGLICHSFSP